MRIISHEAPDVWYERVDGEIRSTGDNRDVWESEVMTFIDFFSGIGGFRLGMEMAGHTCVGHCEIDKFADRSYRAMHEVRIDEWYSDDITRVRPEELPDADCYCFGFPCQAFSIAGKRRGFEDTRGTLFFEIMRLAKERKPKILLAENVKGLLNHEGGVTFAVIINTMDELGYDVEWQLLNSKNFGVPQNRERVFIIGHLRGAGGREVFPVGSGYQKTDGLPRPNTNTITTRTGGTNSTGTYIIENQQYAQISQIVGGRRFKQNGEPMFTLTSQDRHGVLIREATKKGYAEAYEGDSINLAVPGSKTRRGRIGKQIANTLDTSCNQGTLDGYRIRKLTPKECFRLQGFPDKYFERARAVNSDSQLYKQAGNSVTVNVVYEIAKRL